MSKPKVSVLMAVYNGERYLREAIESILNQTFTDFEFIIVDDGSNDNTWQIVTEYVTKDNRIIPLRNFKNIGLTRSLNKGLHLAKGKYIARMDADNLSLEERLEKQVDFLDTHNDFVLVSSNIQLIDEKDNLISISKRDCSPELIPWYLLFYNHIGGHGQVMFRRAPVLYLGGYFEQYTYSQDYELWLRLTEIGKIKILPDVLLKWRHHEETITYRHAFEQEIISLHISRKKISGLIGKPLTLSQIRKLRAFWLYQIDFLKPSDMSEIFYLLKEIFKAFLEQPIIIRHFSIRTFSATLNDLVRTQFLRWGYLSLVKKRFLLAFTSVLHAMKWRNWINA